MSRRPTPFNVTAFALVYLLIQLGIFAVIALATGAINLEVNP